MKWLTIFFLFIFHFSLKAQVFKVGYLFDSQEAQWKKDQVLVVRDGIIHEINPIQIDPKLEIIDLSKKWILPGLIDAHSHLFLHDETFGSDFSVGLKKWVIKGKEEKINLAQRRARQMKEVGFSLARDLGNQGQVELSDFEKIHNLKIVSSGAGYAPLYGQLPPHSKEVGIEYRKITEGYQDHPYSIVKLYADEEPNHNFAALTDLKTMTTRAHEDNKLVAVHAILEKGIDLALDSGADTLEHGTFMSQKQLEKLASKKMIFVPTNAQALFLKAHRKNDSYDDALNDFNHACQNAKLAHRKGVVVAFGSDHYFDFPGEHFGQNLIEILQSFKKCGFSNNELLKMITFNASLTQNLYRVGKLDVGYQADFNVYEKSPALDLNHLLRIHSLYREGKTVPLK